jgi:NhaP-type Na+/H+ or K+/H+ antiporter
VFAVAGAGVGLCLAMMFRQDPDVIPHVNLDDSLPFVVSGLLVGCLFGLVVSLICRMYPRLVPAAGMLAVMSLGAAFTAPWGWLCGYTGIHRFEPVPQRGMVTGAIVGAFLGCLVGVGQWIAERLLRSNPHQAPTEFDLQQLDLRKFHYPRDERVMPSEDDI